MPASPTRPHADTSQPFNTAAVAEFHRAFSLPIRPSPGTDVDESLARLRAALLEEEVGEFVAASEQSDLIAIADALADIVYVADTRNGKPLHRADGKVLKSDQYSPPDIASVLGMRSQ
jgi:predicted HAD superfamily Cof-like phosphohydrolase